MAANSNAVVKVANTGIPTGKYLCTIYLDFAAAAAPLLKKRGL